MSAAVATTGSGKPRISTPGHGGKRPGAGRPKGSKNKVPSKADNTEANNAYADLARARADREKLRVQLEDIKVKQAAKSLVDAAKAEREMGIILKTVGHGLDSIPDILERECGLDAAAIERVIEALDTVRESMYANLASETGEVVA